MANYSERRSIENWLSARTVQPAKFNGTSNALLFNQENQRRKYEAMHAQLNGESITGCRKKNTDLQRSVVPLGDNINRPDEYLKRDSSVSNILGKRVT